MELHNMSQSLFLHVMIPCRQSPMYPYPKLNHSSEPARLGMGKGGGGTGLHWQQVEPQAHTVGRTGIEASRRGGTDSLRVGGWGDGGDGEPDQLNGPQIAAALVHSRKKTLVRLGKRRASKYNSKGMYRREGMSECPRGKGLREMTGRRASEDALTDSRGREKYLRPFTHLELEASLKGEIDCEGDKLRL